MSKKDVIKPGHFKLADRMRPGKDTVPEGYKQDFTQEEAREGEFAKGELPLRGIKSRRKAAAKASGTGPDVKRGRSWIMAREGSMENLEGDDRNAAIKGVPGAFGKKDEATKPREGDKASGMKKNEEPVKSGGTGGE